MKDDLDVVWKALSDPTRRSILDLLRAGPQATTDIVAHFPALTRFGVMKHLTVLRDAGLVHDRWEGRRRINSLNAIPIRLIYERWVSGYQDLWASKLTSLKRSLEDGRPPKKPKR
ncbi:MAG: metalloregulator ArsR/SmtB family transcription factor [Candidatus Latescibacteria bacterium]|nr:metalloregulator ArsR/SmtB family transcription factor [Candidatus Latescibacterota bacterium]